MTAFHGLPLYRVAAPPPKLHTARRRGQAGRVRSTKTWIDRTYASPLEPNDVVILEGKKILAGTAAYDAIRKHAQQAEEAQAMAEPRHWGTGLPDKIMRLHQTKQAIENGELRFDRMFISLERQAGARHAIQELVKRWGKHTGILGD